MDTCCSTSLARSRATETASMTVGGSWRTRGGPEKRGGLGLICRSISHFYPIQSIFCSAAWAGLGCKGHHHGGDPAAGCNLVADDPSPYLALQHDATRASSSVSDELRTTSRLRPDCGPARGTKLDDAIVAGGAGVTCAGASGLASTRSDGRSGAGYGSNPWRHQP